MLLCLYTLLSTAMLPLPDSHEAPGSRQRAHFPLHPGILQEDCLSLSSHSPLAAPSWNLGSVVQPDPACRQMDM